ncbi:MAG: ferrous iron transport protein B [bacterium]
MELTTPGSSVVATEALPPPALQDSATLNAAPKARAPRVLLVGNPNSGKTTLFNALTGLRQKIGNYPGVTVERKIGTLLGTNGRPVEIQDLPGVYSLLPKSPDEQIAVNELLHKKNDGSFSADLVVLVADANSLERSLYLCLQILDLDVPTILVLNMIDEAPRNDVYIEAQGLAHSLGVPVIAAAAKKGRGVADVRSAIIAELEGPHALRKHLLPLPVEVATVCRPAATWFLMHGWPSARAAISETLHVISDDGCLLRWARFDQFESLRTHVTVARQELARRNIPWQQAEARLRFTLIDQLLQAHVRRGADENMPRSEKIDRVLTHRFWGPLILVFFLAVIFQTMFSFAELPMQALENFFAWLGGQVEAAMPAGALRDLIVNGALAGVGAVVVFLPQIVFLFFFLSILEDSGYLARASFMLDRVMAKAGLHGHAVIPLLSSFACAIPGIMATRSIKNPKDRLITIMVAPLMSCSARLPVYALMIGTFIPGSKALGIFSWQGLTLFGLYALGLVMAILAALVLKRFVAKGTTQEFMMELPAYRLPSWRTVLWQMYERAKLFVTNAGKIILAISIVLWFLASYPKPEIRNPESANTDTIVDNDGAVTAIATENPILHSYAGRLGKAIEPVIAPLGFDWKIGLGLITSFAAREVMVGTLATIYQVEDGDENSPGLREALRQDRNPQTGEPVYSTLTALSLLVFFVLACQCMSTVAIVRRETNSWRWPIIMIVYMTSLAYVCSLLVYQGGKFMGWG